MRFTFLISENTNLTVFSEGKDIFLLTYVGQIMSR